MTYGFAYDLPFAALAAIVTLIGMFTSKDKVRLPINATTLLLMILPLWMCITSVFALEPAAAYGRWFEVMKIFFFLLIASSLLNSKQHVEWLTWVLVISVGFFGIKGGLFTIVTGGTSRVYGPDGASFMSDNNAIAIALVMIIPLMYYLRSIAPSRWIRLGLLGAMVLSGIAVLGSQSRGALLAVSAMLFFLWLKSQKKLIGGIVLIVTIPIAIGFMPNSWKDRMRTIEHYEQDASAMGRINAWMMAFNVANDRPLIGGGFELYTKRTFAIYAPDPEDVHAAHSVYFQMLGEHGYVGLALFLAIGFNAWLTARRVIRISRNSPHYPWAGEFAKAIQISLIGYAVGGLFVNIGYWELFYYEVIALMITHQLLLSKHKTEPITKQLANSF